MSKNGKKELKDRILNEMTVDYSNALEKNFELAKKFVLITKEGKIDIIEKEKLTVKEQIKLYLIGKLYAKEAVLIEETSVDNKEFMNELGVPAGTLRPALKELRDNNVIKQMKKGKIVSHSIQVNLIERILKNLEEKLK